MSHLVISSSLTKLQKTFSPTRVEYGGSGLVMLEKFFPTVNINLKNKITILNLSC